MHSLSNFIRIAPAFTLALASLAAEAPAQWTNGQPASGLMGQPSYFANELSCTATGFFRPAGIALDLANGKVYVSDSFNNRVLRFAYPLTGIEPAAEMVFGQSNFTTGIYTFAMASSIGDPRGLAVDATGRLWVTDTVAERVLVFDEAHLINTPNPNADMVLGQPDFSSSGAATTASTMGIPRGLAISDSGTLFVADSSNNRVLRFDNARSKGNGGAADGVLGQPDFVSNTAETSQSGLNSVSGLALYGDTLFVGDSSTRVVRHDNVSSKSNGANADGVLGQPDFTSDSPSTSQSGFSQVNLLAVDPDGRLYVAEGINRRVMIFNDAASKANGANADFVLGQVDFTTVGETLSQSIMRDGTSVAVDPAGHLLVVERVTSRVLQFTASGPLPVELDSFMVE